jgi:hypothetical protein
MIRGALVLLTAVTAAAPALAVPGPESVAVVANANIAESVSLARAYARARQVPDQQVCLLDLPDVADITLEELRTLVIGGIEACLAPDGIIERIEAVVLMRGVPLRVAIPTDAGDQRVSLAAALGAWRSASADGTPLVGRPPGEMATCGSSPCYAAAWRNPFRR